MAKKNTIIIEVEGGLVQEIRNVPDGTGVVVRDYDVEGLGEDEMTEGEDGREYHEIVFVE